MPLPITFATLTSPQPLADFDTQFSAVAALGAIPCTASGTNTIALSPNVNTPTISSYPDLQPSFVWVQQASNTSAVTINVNGVGARNAYKYNGSAPIATPNDLLAGQIYRATPLQALNGGAGGFVVDAIGNSLSTTAIQFIISGGGSAITAGNKGVVQIPWPCFINAWRIQADQVGTISVDILRANEGVPSASIVGGGTKPNLSSSQFNEAAPSGWTATTLAQGDWLGFVVQGGVVNCTQITLVIQLVRQ